MDSIPIFVIILVIALGCSFGIAIIVSEKKRMGKIADIKADSAFDAKAEINKIRRTLFINEALKWYDEEAMGFPGYWSYSPNSSIHMIFRGKDFRGLRVYSSVFGIKEYQDIIDCFKDFDVVTACDYKGPNSIHKELWRKNNPFSDDSKSPLYYFPIQDWVRDEKIKEEDLEWDYY